MRKSPLSLFVGVVASVYSATALGTVTVTGGTNPPTPQQQSNGSWNITFGAGASGNFTINTTAGEALGAVTSVANSDVSISTGSNPRPASIGSVTWTSGSGKFRVDDVRATGDIGTVSVHAITTQMRSESGDLTGNITILNPGATTDIGEIHFDSGELRGDIKNPYGSIFVISCDSVEGASMSSPVTVYCRDTLYEFHVAGAATNLSIEDPASIPSQRTMLVGAVTTGGDFVGDIRARRIHNQNLLTPADTVIDVGRDYIGAIDLSQGVSVGACSLESDVLAPYIPTIRIGRSLHADSVVQVPAYSPYVPSPQVCQSGGIETQVVVNAANGPDGHVDGHVFIGGQELDIDRSASQRYGQYNEPPVDLGYGAVGHVPFAIHGGASSLWLLRDNHSGVRGPFSENPLAAVNSEIPVPFTGLPEYLGAIIEFTGPVLPDNATGSGIESDEAMIVESKPYSRNCDVWDQVPLGFKLFSRTPRRIDFLGAHFYNSGEPGAPTNWTSGDGPIVLANAAYYRIRPRIEGQYTEDKLRCNIPVPPGASNVPLVLGDAMTFLVGCPWPWDLDHNGVINTVDLVAHFLITFGQDEPACGGVFPCTPPCPATLATDFNHDGRVNTSDLTEILARFGQVCEGSGQNGGANLTAGSHGAIVPSLAGTGVNAGTESMAAHHDNADENGAAGIGGPASTASTLPTPPGPLLSALGFTSAQAYQRYVDALTPEGLGEHLEFIAAFARAMEN